MNLPWAITCAGLGQGRAEGEADASCIVTSVACDEWCAGGVLGFVPLNGH